MLYKYKKFKTSPYVNDEVNKLVDVFLNNTNAGLDDTPDLLTLGYYAGNYDGKPDNEYAMQIQDMYVRLDNTIGDLLDMLDRKVGLKNTLIFITSTGYRSPEPEDLPEYRIPTGEFHLKRCSALLNMYLMAIYGQGQYVETYYGNAFSAEGIRIDFIVEDGKDICIVYISKGREPVYTKITNKQGAKEEKFYIRVGNSSREIANASEIIAYVKKHFK